MPADISAVGCTVGGMLDMICCERDSTASDNGRNETILTTSSYEQQALTVQHCSVTSTQRGLERRLRWQHSYQHPHSAHCAALSVQQQPFNPNQPAHVPPHLFPSPVAVLYPLATTCGVSVSACRARRPSSVGRTAALLPTLSFRACGRMTVDR